jgi:cytochrome c peroxidase
MHNRWTACLSTFTLIGVSALASGGCDFVFIGDDDLVPGSSPAPKPPSDDDRPSVPGSLAEEKLPPIYDRITGKPVDKDLLVDNERAIALGKALFWDMQAGSDGQACASCHFSAGADNRARNQLSPGLIGGNSVFDPTRTGKIGPNIKLVAGDFPFHVKKDPDDRDSKVLFDTDDVASSQGVIRALLKKVVPGGLEDVCKAVADPLFQVAGINMRQVEPRNTPTTINAAFNHRNFWDGRANNIFNGNDPFGRRNKDAFIVEMKDGKAVKRKIELVNSSLASQAVGPVLSDLEMSCAGRRMPDVARKLLRNPTTPLAFQKVHPQDSVLGPLATGSKGLKVSYRELIEQAFSPRLWQSDQWFDADKKLLTNPSSVPESERFRLIEINFPLFWGLAIQAYERTLVSDDSPFDRYRDGRDPKALTSRQLAGLDVFMKDGKCVRCHGTAMFTNASTLHLLDEAEEGGLVERMLMSEERHHYGVRTESAVTLHPIQLWELGKKDRTLKLDVEATPTAKNSQIEPGAAVGEVVLGKKGDDSVCRYKPKLLTFGADNSSSRDALIKAERTGGGGSCPKQLKISVRDDTRVGNTWFDFVIVEDGGGDLLFLGHAEASRIWIREPALYDNGFYNIGVRPTEEDLGVGGVDPFGNPLSFTEQYVDKLLGKEPRDPFKIDPCRFDVPWNVVVDDPLFPGGFTDKTKCGGKLKTSTGVPRNNGANRRAIEKLRTAVNGAFKVPTLRNVALTAPYMHNGGMATLEQVVEFYNRGGDFHRNKELDPDITPLGLTQKQREDLVLFMRSLTDPNVVWERAPFDHPELCIPNGLDKVVDSSPKDGRADEDLCKDGVKIPAVGKNGRSSPIKTFLGLEDDELPPPP